ncbi:hypothetical protein D3C86_1615680 [compost metagenome]
MDEPADRGKSDKTLTFEKREVDFPSKVTDKKPKAALEKNEERKTKFTSQIWFT